MKFGADGVGVGVMHVAEDGQGLPPGVTGSQRVTGGMVGVAQAGESPGFFIAVAEVAEQGAGVLVAGDGVGVVAEVVMGVAEAIPDSSLPVTVAEILKQALSRALSNTTSIRLPATWLRYNAA